MSDPDRVLSLLADLVAMPTVGLDHNAEWIGYVQARCEDAGCQTQVLASADGRSQGLVACVAPDAPGGLILSGHVDVVGVEGQDWTTDPFQLRREGDRVVGRGTTDMKGFVACAIAAMEEAAKGRLSRPLCLALSADEETHCQSAISLAQHLTTHMPAPRGVLIGEPTGLEPVNRHRGSYTYRVTVRGRSAHASTPQHGVSATAIAAKLITWLETQSDKNCATGTTHSVGVIEGGSASNTIADHCRFEWDLRLAAGGDLAHEVAQFQAAAEAVLAPYQSRMPDAAVEVTQLGSFPGFHCSEDAEFPQACLAVSSATTCGEFSGGTEAGLYQEAGLPVIVMGPGDLAQAHMPDEFVTLEQLVGCQTQLRRLIHG